MPTLEKVCEECGDGYRSRFKRQKFCAPCQVLRDTRARPWVFEEAHECVACKTKHWPIRTTHTTCYDCSQSASYVHDVACGYCGDYHRIAPGTQNICIRCVQASQERRNEYFTFLKSRAQRKAHEKNAANSEQNSGPAPSEIA
jgi:hypothetical protein